MSDNETRTTRADKWGRNAHRYTGSNCHDSLNRRRMERWCGGFEKPTHIIRQQPLVEDENVFDAMIDDIFHNIANYARFGDRDWERYAIDPKPNRHLVREVDNTPDEVYQQPIYYGYEDDDHGQDDAPRITYWRNWENKPKAKVSV